jgi:hypothetical protein
MIAQGRDHHLDMPLLFNVSITVKMISCPSDWFLTHLTLCAMSFFPASELPPLSYPPRGPIGFSSPILRQKQIIRKYTEILK